MIEDNIRLKCQHQDLKLCNQKYLDILGTNERVNQAKGFLAVKATQELDFHLSKHGIMAQNISKLNERERAQLKNIKGLIKYAKKLTLELEEYKDKVKMAEKIIQDLRNTGNESLDSLINMLATYQQKQVQLAQEIVKLKQLILMKDDEIVGLDEDISQLSGFVSTAKGKLEVKVDDLLHTLEENRRIIRRHDKIIVDLQQKNEVSQCNIAETAEQAQKRGTEKLKLQLQLKELGDQKSTIQDSIHNMESKLVTFRTVYAGSQNSAPQQVYHHSISDSQIQHQQSIQWKDADNVVVQGGDLTKERSASQLNAKQMQQANSPLKSALSQKNTKHKKAQSFSYKIEGAKDK